MARIRTIKPEFFTSEDIVERTPFARLLYVALWCEADKEGRLLWKPKTFKMRYFPADDLDIEALCAELTQAGLVVLYGQGLAHIPSFTTHQHINPRETASSLPEPDACGTRRPRVSTRDASDSDAQGGREGKGKEGTRDASRDALPGFERFWETWPKSVRKESKGKCLEAWRKAGAESQADLIVAHVEGLKQTPGWSKDGGQFVPAPLVYLNNRRWEGAEAPDTAANDWTRNAA